jgi:hypothetical protein
MSVVSGVAVVPGVGVLDDDVGVPGVDPIGLVPELVVVPSVAELVDDSSSPSPHAAKNAPMPSVYIKK